MTYKAPVKDMLFDMEALADVASLAQLPGFEEAGLDTAQAILEESARFNEEVVAPLNAGSDRQGAQLQGTEVTTSPGFKEAYRQFAEAGWQGIQHPVDFGGQGLPKLIAAACEEIVQGASLSFALCPMLTDGAIDALLTAGSEELKRLYLPKLVSGEWAGTMNLTEPQAGSDLSLVRTRATKQADGTYRLFGTKIFITYGEHDYTDNIVHLVLARLDGAPEGIKGLSLFLVPKFMLDAAGAPATRNDVYCTGLEHKLGIHGSPTAVLQFGDHGGAIGYLVGQENEGLKYMFVMMNASRFAVGVQGFAVAERAYQHAVVYARERIQSRPVDGSSATAVPIIEHPDVRRMLLTMRAHAEGCRAMALVAAAAYDRAHHHPDAQVRHENEVFYEFLVPLVKGYGTEVAQEAVSLGVQVHGGAGFIEETGASQFFRDARILTIYEGTTAIQANDLLGRKTLRDGGAFARAIAARVQVTEGELDSLGSPEAQTVRDALRTARQAFLEAVDFLVAHGKEQPNQVYAGSVPYLMLAGTLVTGWLLGRSLLTATAYLGVDRDAGFMHAKIAVALFNAGHILTRAKSLREAVVQGGEGTMALPAEAF